LAFLFMALTVLVEVSEIASPRHCGVRKKAG